MFLLRHAESFFNLHFSRTRRDPGIEDPELTATGHAQAEAAAEQLARQKITRIIVSPYTRALQTAEPILKRHPVLVDVMQEVRERFVFMCDIGRHPEWLAARFPHHRFDHLPEQWWPALRESPEAALERANRFRTLMAARDDHSTTLLISHWSFLLALSGTSLTNAEVTLFDPTKPPPLVQLHP
jgi:broad specificity phosphatase PhoE